MKPSFTLPSNWKSSSFPFWGVLGAILLLLPGCTMATGFSGATTPLPKGQIGSLTILNGAPGNCYVGDASTCSTATATTGTYGIKALATVTYGSSNALFLGDAQGNVYEATVPSSSTPPTPTSCITGGGTPITSLALIPGSSTPGTLLYSTSTGLFYSSASSSSCGGSTAITSPSTFSSSLLTYNSSVSAVIGVTTTGSYFSCTSSTPSCSSLKALPSLSGTPTVLAIGSDPQYAAVYVTTSSNGTYTINFYSVSSAGGGAVTLTSAGSYTGSELSSPSGVALFHGSNPTQQYCTATTGGCNFMEVVNAGNDSITQYVLTYTLSGSTPTTIVLNQFNSSYLGCDLFNSSPIAAIQDPTTGAPAVFAGQDGTSFGPCLGVTSGTTFGKYATAYTIVGE